MIGILAMAAPHHPASGATQEARVKAAYLFKLSSFVRWPPTAFASASAPLRICTAGRSDINEVLVALVRNQQVGGRRIAAVEAPVDEPAQGRNCHTLFVGRNSPAWRDLMAATGQNPVLTITDRAGGTSGGVVEFLQRGGNIRLAVSRREAEARKLELSSKLVAIAEPAPR